MAQYSFEGDFVLIGKYKMIPPKNGGLLGQGAFGKVYKGIDPTTKKMIAIKMIPKKNIKHNTYFEKSFEREVDIQKKIQGKNIVNYIDLIDQKDNFVLVTEFCNEGDLAKKIEMNSFSENPGLSENLIIQYLKDFISGYKILHKNLIIHRDIKPGNLLIHDGVLKIADFGLSKLMDSDQTLQMTLGIGSPIYMAPEVLFKEPYDNKCDMWSLGVTLHESLFGESPWSLAKSLPDLQVLLLSLQKNPYKFPGKEDSKLRPLLEGMLKFDPNERITWEQLFEDPINKFTTVGVDELSENVLKKRYQSLAGTPGIDLPNGAKTELKKSGSKMEESKGESTGKFSQVLKTSGTSILDQSSMPFSMSSKQSSSLLRNESLTDEELRAIIQKEESKKIYKRNKNIIRYRTKIAQYIFYAYNQCEQIFKSNMAETDENSFFSQTRLIELEGIFLKTACIILETMDELQLRNSLNIEQWENFIQTNEYKQEKNVVCGLCKGFKDFFIDYLSKLTTEEKTQLDSCITSEEFQESAKFKEYIYRYEKEFVLLCYAMIKRLGKKLKRDFLIVVEYVINTLQWKTVFYEKKGKKEQNPDIEKFLETVQYDGDSELFLRIQKRIEDRYRNF